MEELIRITFYLSGTFVLLKGESTVSLEPKQGNVVKGENITLTCSASGGHWHNISQWSIINNGEKKVGYITDIKSECHVTNELSNTSKYYCRCDEQHQYSTVIINVGIGRHGEIWTCKQYTEAAFEITSPNVTLTVDVPVAYAIVNDSTLSTIEREENTYITLKCVSSQCRPVANITWHFRDKDGEIKNVTFSESINFTENNTLISTRNWISFYASRDMNGWSVRCNASNIRNYPQQTFTVKLNVTYPTNIPTIQCSDVGTYKVIRNRFSNLTCSVDGGNPPGHLEWSCDKTSIDGHMPQHSLSKTIVLNATQATNCTCTSSNVAGSRKMSVQIDVMFPPMINDMNNTKVIEGDSVFLKCDVGSANPPVKTFEWTSSKHSVSESTLMIPNVSRSDDMMYTCTANNTMDPSCQGVVNGSTSKSLHVEVLYPPLVTISSPISFTRNASEMFKYSCPIVNGNPSNAAVVWRRSSDTKTWNSTELLLPNISRHDDSIYTCYASNVMTDSNGTTKYGNSSGYITLVVQFRTKLTDFFIQGYRHNTSVVVMEHTRLTFECRLQSKPTATILLFEKDSVRKSYNANELFYNTTASCSSEPVLYSCHGNNLLNTKPSTRDVQLFVKCIPRVDMNTDVQINATCAINQTVTLSYTALAYPHPSFVWYRQGSSINTRDARITISSTDMQTNLTIANVHESDLGEYILIVTNDVGSISESFRLKPDGVPGVPTHLTQDDSSTTVSSLIGDLVSKMDQDKALL